MADLRSRASSALEGRYGIERRLGEGGMATVYLARDLRHERDVALKVLRPEVAAAVGVERFLAEIRTTASLQHPHILPLFDSGEADGLVFYVMPHVEGESLGERLQRERQLPVDEAVRIAVGVARALEHAHERGVIHRDVKPANILLSKNGEPLVADFGIAIAASHANQDRLTETGLSLGTPGYMSPEQATGEGPLDPRSDVYALGCVLYEMLVGRPPHEGPTAQAVLTRVLAEAPRRVRASRPAVPLHVDAAVAKALEPLAADRFSSAGELARALRDPAFRHGAEAEGLEAGAAGPARSPPRTWRLLAGAGWIVAALALGWGLLSHVGGGDPASGGAGSEHPFGVARFAHPLAADRSFSGTSKPLVATSPDGSSFVFAADGRLYLRDMAELEAVPIRGTEGAPTTPFFSPDGRTVGYWDEAAGELRRIAVAGGTPVLIARASEVYGASWGSDDRILYARPDGVWRVPASGGSPEHLVPIEPSEVAHGPSMLPDGETVLFTVAVTASMIGQSTAWDSARVVLHSLATGERRELLRGGDARYVPTGHLVYALDRVLFAVPFDARTKEVRGGPVPVLEGVQRAIRGSGGLGGAAFYAFSRTGTLVYVPAFWGEGEMSRRLLAVDLEGNAEPLVDEERNYWRPRISPGGTQVAVEVLQGATYQTWIVDLARRQARPLAFGGEDVYPVWTPDGRSVAYWSTRDGVRGVYLRSADGSDEPELILEGARATDISRDRVVSFVFEPAGGSLGTVLLDEGGRASDFLVTSAKEHMARFSPDGRWLAYTSNESGRDEIYVRPYPRAQGVGRLVSSGGGSGPVWAPDGSALYYRGASGDLMAVPTTLAPTFTAGRPEPLFRFAGRFRMSGTETAYDIHPDGRRFIMVSEPEGETAVQQRIHVVRNWFEELRVRAR